METSIGEIAKLINGEVFGNSKQVVKKVAKIEEAEEGDITFLANKKYLKFLNKSNASAFIVDKTITAENKNLIRVDNPYFAFIKVFQFFNPPKEDIQSGIHQSVLIGSTSKLGKNLSIGAFVFIGDTCEIGKNKSADGKVFT